MASLKHLLNDDDLSDYLQPSSLINQDFSQSSRSSDDLDTPPTLPEGNWSSLITELHGTYIGNDDYIGLQPFSAPDALYIGDEHWYFNVEQWGADAFSLQDNDSGKGLSQCVNGTCLDTNFLSVHDNPQSQRVCYGLIYRAAAKLTGDMSNLRVKISSTETPRISGHAVLNLRHDFEGLWLTFGDGTKFAQLNAHLAKILPPILDIPGVEMDGLVDLIAFRQTLERATKANEASLRVGINIYGARDATRDLVGRELSKAKIFLQTPDHTREGIAYENPHFLQIDSAATEDIATIQVEEHHEPEETAESEDFRAAVSTIYGALKRGAHLNRLEADASLQTPLLLHQQEGLDFMLQREIGPIPDQFCLWQPEEQEGEMCYRHVITKALSHERPSETGGGILADAMGLGKTLSTLSLIAKTRESARAWIINHQNRTTFEADGTRQSSRATLVLVSSYLLLNHWLSEVDQHLNGTFIVMKYHGQRRERNSAIIADSDIVFTTYHTLAAEMANGTSPLREIVWYRIVLDEAHIIRHRRTTFYQNCSQLVAVNRWCLTGTPIQNTLDDIGALFTFVNVRPFDSIGTFRTYITTPFDEGPERRKLASERLASLIDSLCLRRTRDVVELPEQREVLQELDFSYAEREQYQRTKEMMNRAIRQRFGDIDRKNVFGLFQAQLQLRLLCNHGTFQNPFSWTSHRNMITERETALDLFGQSGEVTCACCQQPLPLISTNSTYSRYFSCRHVCCLECLEQSTNGEDIDLETRASKCPVCESRNMHVRKKKQFDVNTTVQNTPDYFRETGFSTKIAALAQDIVQGLWSNKSVIFSCWTRTLDLIERHFNTQGIPFKRIDGTSPLHARQATLDDFSRNPLSPILLMTTGTGAFGLNIPVATRVFIVESQWNPHTERQAIARAMRLGQQHGIVVYRYIIKQSVEQEMRSQQERKLQIAEVGW